MSEEFDKKVAELAEKLGVRKGTARKKLTHKGFSKKGASRYKVKR